MLTTRIRILLILLICTVFLIPFRHRIRSFLYRDHYTVKQRLEQYEEQVRQRLLPYFHKAGIAYPPAWMGIVAIKNSKELEVWVAPDNGAPVLLRSYPILAASGTVGPKLKEGDFQVPEGIYQVESLNPNSLYHLALRVDYPNTFDRTKAELAGRSNLGGDIMIHGDQVSIGCLAMGDEAIEDIFVLAARVWPSRIPIIISPVDFRKGETVPDNKRLPPWHKELYDNIRSELNNFRLSGSNAASGNRS